MQRPGIQELHWDSGIADPPPRRPWGRSVNLSRPEACLQVEGRGHLAGSPHRAVERVPRDKGCEGLVSRALLADIRELSYGEEGRAVARRGPWPLPCADQLCQPVRGRGPSRWSLRPEAKAQMPQWGWLSPTRGTTSTPEDLLPSVPWPWAPSLHSLGCRVPSSLPFTALGAPPAAQLSSQALAQQGLASSAHTSPPQPPRQPRQHTHSQSNLRLKLSSPPGRMKGSQLPREGGDGQRQMGNPEKGPELNMEREVFAEGPSGSCPSAWVGGQSLCWAGGRGDRWCRGWVWSGFGLPLAPQLGVGSQASQAARLSGHFWPTPRGHTETGGCRLRVWSGGGVGLQPVCTLAVWPSQELSGGLADDPAGHD